MLPAFAIAVLAAIWGYNWIMLKIGVSYSAPFTFSALRSLLGALALFAVLALLRKPLSIVSVGRIALVGLLQTTGFIGLSTWALAFAGAGKTAVLVYTMPLWVLVFAWPLLGERVRGLQWAALAAGLAGLALVTNVYAGFGDLRGDALAVGSGASWALGSIFAKRLLDRSRIEVLSLTAWQMLFGSLPLVLVALLAPSAPIVWSTPFVVALLYNVFLATALAWTLWTFALQRLSAADTGMASFGTPLVGVIAAWLQLGERPGPAELAGIALVLLALGLISLRGLRLRTTLSGKAARMSTDVVRCENLACLCEVPAGEASCAPACGTPDARDAHNVKCACGHAPCAEAIDRQLHGEIGRESA